MVKTKKQQAQELLDNELFNSMYNDMLEEYFVKFLDSSDEEERNKLYYRANGVEESLDYIRSIALSIIKE